MPFLYFNKHRLSWTIPSLTTLLQGLKNLVMSKIDCNFVDDIWLEGWWHFLYFAGSPNFEINHACLEICHAKQMQHWRSQFVFGVVGYCPIWRVKIILLTFLKVQCRDPTLWSEYIWIILSALLMCMHALHCFPWNFIMNYQTNKKPKQNKITGFVRMKP